MALIHNPAFAEQVYKHALGSGVSISVEELLALSPEIRQWFCEAITLKRLPMTVPC